MYLSPEDATLFYKLMFSLQCYVSQQCALEPTIASPEAYSKLAQQAKLVVRNALYAQPALIDRFVNENPFSFVDDALAIVASWKNFVAGNFYIERYLPHYSIWIATAPPANVYQVCGITHSLEEIIERVYLPLQVKAVLLPFKDQIIYDGFLSTYPTRLGGGLKVALRQEYMTAKEQGRILERLTGPAPQ